jgi:endonuclease/exonuclease/phosphatase family metal-dependent hydrolase
MKLKHENSLLPTIICGDFNSMPSSSGLSVLQYDKMAEQMLSGKAIWTVPEDIHPRKREYYAMVWDRLLSKRAGFLETLGSF